MQKLPEAARKNAAWESSLKIFESELAAERARENLRLEWRIAPTAKGAARKKNKAASV